MWISRLIRDSSGRIVHSFVEFAEHSKTFTDDKTGKLRNLLDGADVQDAQGADRIRKSINGGAEGGSEPPSVASFMQPHTSGRNLYIPDLSSMPPLGEFIRGSPADGKKLLASLSGLNRRYGPYDVHIAQAKYLDDAVGFNYHASIRDPDNGIVGILERKIYQDDKGRIVVDNRVMDLDEDATGQGFATAFNSAMEGYYRRSGVDRITVFATDDGGYVWARAGYDFDTNPDLLKESVSSITDKIRNIYNNCSPADRVQLDDMLRRFEGRVIEYPSPNELASLTGDDRELGKTLMKNTAWYGVRVL
ncbi:Uncharacterised protein [Nocardia otitidiscaviarum]|uniref:Uncharacterized protein n=1 Tax=Nocardia otitidiscaviarum TaxID=1823 RepID=A0A379JJ25_9NOCA|nr:hypothetical protein [Nocardia otitidiscaviarum]SUD48414.1 Uncharacterised protein [Nocardia otitidiscaviarum]